MALLAEELRSCTAKPERIKAYLALEDGTVFEGYSCGVPGEAYGEICFNTSLEGYLETISDPSYAGQILVMTYPQIGNYGVTLADLQSRDPALRGLVVHDLCPTPSNWRSDMTLAEFLKKHSIIAIEDIDTRALVRHIRDNGAMKAVLSTEDSDYASLVEKAIASDSIVGLNLVEDVSCQESYEYPREYSQSSLYGESDSAPEDDIRDFALEDPQPALYNVVAYDCGVKRSILDGLHRAGCKVTVVPWDTPAEDVLALEPDGVFLSNGPGDPEAVSETSSQAEKLLGKVPVFGICLGHQMISRAAGGKTYKLKYGHRGANQPVMNLLTGRVEITAQNHGFNVDFTSLGKLVPELSGGRTEHVDDLRKWITEKTAPVVQNERYGRIQLTHVNVNDGTAEGIAFLDIPAFSVQYHPEANPGPTDSHYLFTAFTRLMQGHDDYLDIDIAEDRLAGWRF